jgi:ABC-type nitrate/sulfonate/bicarbonate transport system substrate-binding protein
MSSHPWRAAVAVALVAAVALAACGGDNGSSRATPPARLVGTVTAAGISPDRCAANKAAGKITYLSGFDFAASASIVEVVVAKQKGYFDQMCLDVDLKSSFSTANYPLVASGQAQFASAGSYSEVLQQSTGGAKLAVVVDDGKQSINVLLVKPSSGVTTLADLKGKTIGVLAAMPQSITAMLVKAGLRDGRDYHTVLLDGFDPVAHFEQQIAGRPGFRSNEPGILERAGVPFTMFDPAADGIPGSFGLIYTSQDFLAQHPTAVQDFVRASMKGLADAIADPAAAVATCVDLMQTAGNQNHLTQEGESFRWQTEAKVVTDSTPKGQPVGLIDPALLKSEVDAYTAAGVFASPPAMAGTYDAELVKGVYDASGRVIWPATASN